MIYLDTFYFGWSNNNPTYFTDINEIPHGCDLVGITFYTCSLSKIVEAINDIRTKTKRLIVTLNETCANICDLLTKYEDDPDIQFSGDLVLNYPTTNFCTDISWFISPRNYYREDQWAKELLSQLTFNNNKSFKVDCLLGKPRSNRDLIEDCYLTSPHKESIFFTYFKNNVSDGHWNISIPDNLIATSEPVEIVKNYQTSLSSIIPVSIYNQSHYSVVAETMCENEYSFFTEKIAKPILAQRVFVVFAGQWYLRNLRSLGFKTFDSIIDESYDAESDLTIRFKRAWQQIEYLCQQDVEKIQEQSKHIREHNLNHFLTNDWHANVKKYITNWGG